MADSNITKLALSNALKELLEAQSFEKIHVSAGKIGAQITLSPDDLARVAKADFAEVIV